MKTFLKQNLIDKANYHFTYNVETGKISRDITLFHESKCDSEIKNEMKIYCVFKAENSGSIIRSTFLLIALISINI